MPFGQIVIGPPGSGKTTYCWGLYQFFQALERPVVVINLDPASKAPPYPHSLDLASLVSLDDCMREFQLGPNGAMLYCLEYLEHNLDWLEHQLDRVIQHALAAQPSSSTSTPWTREDMYVVFDTPGQVELSTNHQSLKRVLDFLDRKMKFRLAAVHLTDSSHILDPAKYISVLLLSLRTMLQLELPHINVLSKIDLLALAGDLPFNLDFYTEVQDLTHLLPLLERDDHRMAKFGALNAKIVDLVEEFGLVSFETLAVEDKESMMSLVSIIDQALGYRPPPVGGDSAAGHRQDDHGSDDEYGHAHAHEHGHTAIPRAPAHFAQSVGLKTATVQEKWVDDRDAYRRHDAARWEQEGDERIRKANDESERRAAAYRGGGDEK
ncbi:hypothetical protein JCM11491_003455 [Sporobolomyces phaffii]